MKKTTADIIGVAIFSVVFVLVLVFVVRMVLNSQ